MSGSAILYITGTNTGVGKTTLTIQLLHAARERNLRVAALKPFCSGGREDAEQLHALQNAGLSLDEVNPFYFRDLLTPLQAARNEGRSIDLADILARVQSIQQRGFPIVIEGAGGLLSPLGEGFSLHEVIQNIPGKVCIVGRNELGVLNSTLLTARQLPVSPSDQAMVLMATENADPSAATNAFLLKSLLPASEIYEIPFLHSTTPRPPALAQILDWWIPSHH